VFEDTDWIDLRELLDLTLPWTIKCKASPAIGSAPDIRRTGSTRWCGLGQKLTGRESRILTIF
jgi:hypothetical protein